MDLLSSWILAFLVQFGINTGLENKAITPVIQSNLASPEETPRDTAISVQICMQKELSGNFLVLPTFSATLTDTLVLTDQGLPGASPDDYIEYTLTITNPSTTNSRNFVVATIHLDENTTYVSQSVKSSVIAVNDNYSTIGNISIAVPVANGVLQNDINLDNDPLTAEIHDISSLQGNINLNTDGSFTFLPAAGFRGETSFTYKVNDGSFTRLGKVTFTITSAIWFIKSGATAPGNGTFHSPFPSFGSFMLLANDMPGDRIFLYSGTYSGSLALLDSQRLVGQGTSSASLYEACGLTGPLFPLAYSSSLPTLNGTSPVINSSVVALTAGKKNRITGINISNTSGTCLFANTFDSLTIRNVELANTGGIAAEVNGGFLDVEFKKISSSGGTHGIKINNTTGSFKITGTGTTDNSGGIIQSFSQRGIEINNAKNVQLYNLKIQSTSISANQYDCKEDQNLGCYAGIHAVNVQGLVLQNIDIPQITANGFMFNNVKNLTMMECTADQTGNYFDESGITGLNLSGTSSITSCSFQNLGAKGISVIRTNNDTLNLTMDNCVFINTSTSAYGQDLMEISAYNSSLSTINIKNSTFQNAKTKGIQGTANDSSLLNLSVTGCTIETLSPNMGGIDFSASDNATLKYNLNQNTKIVSKGEVAVLTSSFGTATIESRINSNSLIKKTATEADVFSGVRVLQEGNGWIKSEIKNNTSIQLINGETAVQGVSRNANSFTGRLDFITSGNTISADTNSVDAIEMRTASSLASTELNTGCLKAANNHVTAASLRVFRVRKVNAASQLLLEGLGTNITNYWTLNGNTSTGDSIVSYGTLMYGATCVAPAHPTVFSQASEVATESPVKAVKNAIASPTIIDEVSNNPYPTNVKPAYSVTQSGQSIQVGGSGFTIPAEKYITVKVRVKVNSTIPAGVCTIAAQGSISSQYYTDIKSDDPYSPYPDDSTFTDLRIPVTVSCPQATTVDINTTSCTSTQTFAATYEGCPSVSLNYKIQNQSISFPYSFPVGASIVSVTASNATSSSDTCSFTVTVNPAHTAYAVGGSDTLCSNGTGATISLADSDIGIYYILYKDGSSTGQSLYGNGESLYFEGLNTTGIYKIQGISYVGCTINMLDSAIVNIISLPEAGAGKDTTLCGAGSTLSLEATVQNGTGSWSVLSGPSTSQLQFSNTLADTTVFTAAGGPGTYKALWKVDNSVCSADSALYTIYIKNSPISSAGNDTTLCLGETISLNASAQFGTGTWNVIQMPDGATTMISNPSDTNADFNSSNVGLYMLAWIVSETSCPSKTDTVNINVLANPSSFLLDTQAICSNMTILPLIVNSVSTTFSFTWTRDALANISGMAQMGTDSFPGKLINLTNQPVDVHFLIQAGNCKISEFPAVVTVNPNPTASFVFEESSGLMPDDGNVCGGDSVVVKVSGASSYSWEGGGTSDSLSITPSKTTVYTVSLTSAVGCENVDSVSIQVFTKPDAAIDVFDDSGIIANDAVLCRGDSLSLVADTGFSYIWSDSSTGNEVHFLPLSDQTFLCTMTDINGCFDTDSIAVTINMATTLTLSALENSVVPNDGIVCRGADVTLQVSGAKSYTWGNGETTEQIIVQPQSNSTYYVTALDTDGCQSKDSILIQTKTLPNVAISGPTTMICAGTGSYLTATGGNIYVWSDGQTGASIFVNPGNTTTYIVTITDIDGCTATADFMYLVDLCCIKPTIIISQVVQPTCQQGGSVSFTGLPGGAWSLFQEGIIRKLYSSSGSQFTASDIPAGVYRFRIVDENGCSSLPTPPFQAILVDY